MRKVKQYTVSDFFSKSGAVVSINLPDDCNKIVGVYFQVDYKGIAAPNNKPFIAANISVLLNNRNDNSIHNYPIICRPDNNGKMSNGHNYSLHKNKIPLNTPIKRGSVITLIVKDSEYMKSYIADILYAAYNPNIDLYVIYNDLAGDWSNDTLKEIRLVTHKN